jgi:hydroxymethylpyrimidine/phosphomethylpyrimidine kinase
MTQRNIGRVLIIAGSDSGGGAGIQADIKTVTALGGFAMTAVTALTAQNTQGVMGVVPIEPNFIAEQMRCVLEDIGADCIKTGMLHSSTVIETVSRELDRSAKGIPLVVDPVMFAKGGHSLLEADAISAMCEELIPRAALVTPNIPEAESLAGYKVVDIESMKQAGESIRMLGATAALIKGGHMEGPSLTDVLVDADRIALFNDERIDTRHTHGTGCTLASAIAAGLADGLDLQKSIERARAYVREAIITAPGLGQGHGPMNHGHTVDASTL